ALRYGYLNVVTSSFIATLIGVGVAYGIHPVSEYELEGAHTRDPKETVRKTYHRTGAPVAVAALTTATAFFSIRLMQFRGFAELGAVAGAGVLLCLAAALVTLPAVLVVYGRWRHARDRRHRASTVDRIWVERAATRICRRPALVVALALVLTAVLGWFARGITFDTNLLEILPRNSESQIYFERMAMESDLSPAASVVTANDIAELRALRTRAAAEPAILRFESALQFLPEDPARSLAAIDRLATLLDRLDLPQRVGPVRSGPLEESALRLEEALAAASEDAFGAGMAAVAGSLEDARAAAEEIAALAGSAGPEEEARWTDAQDRLLGWGRLLLSDLRRAAGTAEPDLETMPEPVRKRFVTADGRLLAYLKPHDNVFDSEVLDEYVAASRRVQESAFGFPVVFHRVAGQITSGFYNAVIIGAVLVFVILLIDFRGAREAGLAMIPLFIGMVWMLGWMGVLGLSFNFANLIAVPLVIGVGIDNGVHVIHRLRIEGERGMGEVLRHTGRAILIASLTTMIGFGSLALASHRGLESLGVMLLLGVGSCLVTATVVLPNLLVVLGKARR
ncbi:MAG: MMPL family transporter, partial [Acidobacteriota bacterium]|nr:MMPL family transporter [Acidobacteriota bacterium]